MQLSRRQIIAYSALGLVVAAVGARYLLLPQSAGPSGAEIALAPVAASPAAVQPSVAASPAPDVVVYVCGAVRSPGVVRLPADARVADALELAGGALGGAQLDAVNLAARVVDGQQILVPERGASATGPAAAGAAAEGSGAVGAPAAPVNINTASLDDLDGLEGVGPATAQKIIDYRSANGPFGTIDDIKNVSGIGDAKFAAIKDSITV